MNWRGRLPKAGEAVMAVEGFGRVVLGVPANANTATSERWARMAAAQSIAPPSRRLCGESGNCRASDYSGLFATISAVRSEFESNRPV